MTPTGSIEEGNDWDALNARCDSLWMIVDGITVTPPLEPMEPLLEPGARGPKSDQMRRVWEELTRPEHLEVFEQRLSRDLNPTARERTVRELEDCRRRKSTGTS